MEAAGWQLLCRVSDDGLTTDDATAAVAVVRKPSEKETAMRVVYRCSRL
jgi:hypothetical protein